MKWTADPPTKPGWYWLRTKCTEPHVVQVYDWHGFLRAMWPGVGDHHGAVSKLVGEWAGPIPEPEP